MFHWQFELIHHKSQIWLPADSKSTDPTDHKHSHKPLQELSDMRQLKEISGAQVLGASEVQSARDTKFLVYNSFVLLPRI